MASGGRRAGGGRKRTPTRLRVLRGNPRDKPLNLAEPDPSRGVPDPPDWLNNLELEGWTTLTEALASMGVVTIADGPALTLLAVAWAEWREARAVLSLEEPYYQHEDDGGMVFIRKHPATAVASDAARRVASLLAEFGLTPSSRSRLEVGAASVPDSFADFRQRRRPGDERGPS